MSGANRLPKWVTSNEASVWRETEQSRRMTPEERWADVVAACDSLKLYWDIPGYPERIKAAVDPLPESSRVALACGPCRAQPSELCANFWRESP